MVNPPFLKKLKGCIWGPYCFLHSGERGHVAALLNLKSKWFATLTLNNGNHDEQCCVNVSPTDEKTLYEQGEDRTFIQFSQ